MENPAEQNVRNVVASKREKIVKNPQVLEQQSINQAGQQQALPKKKSSWWIWLIVILVLRF